MGILANSRERLRLSRRRRELEGEPRPHGLAELAQSYLMLGDERTARDVLQFASTLFPGSAELHRVQLLLASAESQGRLSQAKQAVRANPSPQTYLELADAYRGLGRREQCRETLRELLVQFGDHCTALTQLGELRFEGFLESLAMVDGTEAQALLTRAITADREALKPRFVLADLYYRVGAHHHAVASLKSLLELSAEHERARQLLDEMESNVPAEGELHEDFLSVLAQVESNMELAHPVPPWGHIAPADPDQQQPFSDPQSEVERLARESGAANAILVDDQGSAWSSIDQSVLVDSMESVSAVSQRATRGMELGVPSRLVIESELGSLVIEHKHGALMGLILPQRNDVLRAAVSARDSLERVVRG